jgi:outer membrane protein OmpA-like peptidoglycan-associated protein
MDRRIVAIILVAAMLLVVTGCNMTRRDKGAVIGAAAGGVAGGAIGNSTGSTTRGVIIGAAVGGIAGGIIGHQMDQQAKDLAYELPGAVVTRVGEGIAVTFPEGLLFAYDSDAITPGAGDNLKKFAASLSKYPRTKSMIVGHTDARGSTDYNLGLSERRARRAADFISAQGVDRDRLGTTGRGATEPLVNNETDAGRQQNRRIEIAIVADEAFRRQTQSHN